jgi:hypothetical protein
MVASLTRARPLPVLAAAALLATALMFVASATVRAGTPTCSLLVTTDSSPVPAETATVFVGENGAVTGSGFTPDSEITITIAVNAALYATFPQMTDGSGGFTFGGPVQPDQVGTLVVTATDGQVCSDSVTVTVLAAPVPSASGLPNAAMLPAGTPMSGASALALAVLGVALVALVAVSIRSRRPV